MSKIEKLSTMAQNVSCVAIVLIAALILLEIVLRSIAGVSTMISEEYSAYLLAIFASMAFANGFKSGGHIRVDLVLSKLPRRARAAVDLACTLLAFFVFCYIVVQTWILFYDSLSSGETSMYFSRTPLWIPKAWLVLGSVVTSLQLFSMVISSIRLTNWRAADSGRNGGASSESAPGGK